jgi:hypothetical protein
VDQQIELTFWASVKDSSNPAVLSTYLERCPAGEFAAIARALIAHYEQQAKAEQARREEEEKRQAEERKAAEVPPPRRGAPRPRAGLSRRTTPGDRDE